MSSTILSEIMLPEHLTASRTTLSASIETLIIGVLIEDTTLFFTNFGKAERILLLIVTNGAEI